MKEFLYRSQLQTKIDATLISTKDKQELDGAIIEVTYMDGRSLKDFRKEGMMKFLNLAIPW